MCGGLLSTQTSQTQFSLAQRMGQSRKEEKRKQVKGTEGGSLQG